MGLLVLYALLRRTFVLKLLFDGCKRRFDDFQHGRRAIALMVGSGSGKVVLKVRRQQEKRNQH